MKILNVISVFVLFFCCWYISVAFFNFPASLSNTLAHPPFGYNINDLPSGYTIIVSSDGQYSLKGHSYFLFYDNPGDAVRYAIYLETEKKKRENQPTWKVFYEK